jgi:hypothetical protein
MRSWGYCRSLLSCLASRDWASILTSPTPPPPCIILQEFLRHWASGAAYNVHRGESCQESLTGHLCWSLKHVPFEREGSNTVNTSKKLLYDVYSGFELAFGAGKPNLQHLCTVKFRSELVNCALQRALLHINALNQHVRTQRQNQRVRCCV